MPNYFYDQLHGHIVEDVMLGMTAGAARPNLQCIFHEKHSDNRG